MSNNARLPDEGLLLILSGPSGSGKSTLVRQLMENGEFPVRYSTSATSRPPRPGERDGVDYYFLSKEEFARRVKAGEFLEHALVHDNYYGTPTRPVLEALRQRQWVLLEIDVQGFRLVKEKMPQAVSFFVRAPSIEEYESRLQTRGTDSVEVIARRVKAARDELAAAAEYDFQIVNEYLPQALRTLSTLLRGLASAREPARQRAASAPAN